MPSICNRCQTVACFLCENTFSIHLIWLILHHSSGRLTFKWQAVFIYNAPHKQTASFLLIKKLALLVNNNDEVVLIKVLYKFFFLKVSIRFMWNFFKNKNCNINVLPQFFGNFLATVPVSNNFKCFLMAFKIVSWRICNAQYLVVPARVTIIIIVPGSSYFCLADRRWGHTT